MMQHKHNLTSHFLAHCYTPVGGVPIPAIYYHNPMKQGTALLVGINHQKRVPNKAHAIEIAKDALAGAIQRSSATESTDAVISALRECGYTAPGFEFELFFPAANQENSDAILAVNF